MKARRDTFGYRSGRFLARHKASVAAVILVFASLVGGILTTVRQTRIATAEHDRAERRLQDVRKLASSFLFEFHDAIRNLPGSTPARELIVRRALEYLGTLAKEAGGDPDLQRDLADAYEKLAEVQGVYGDGLGDSAGALSSLKAAVQIRERLVAGPAPDPKNRRRLARTLQSYGAALGTTGDVPNGTAASRRAVEILEAAVRDSPSDRELMNGLAEAHFSLSNRLSSAYDLPGSTLEMRRSLAAYEALLAEAPRDWRLRRSVALCNKYIASNATNQKDPAAALAGYRKSLAIEQGLVAEDPTNALFKRDLSHSWGGCGEALFALGRSDEGEEAYGKAIALRQELAAADPKDKGIREAVARGYTNLGEHLTKAGQARKALASLGRARPILDELVVRDPTNVRLAAYRATLATYFGHAHAALGDFRAGRAEYDTAVREFEGFKAQGRLHGNAEPILAEALEGRARCDAALAAAGSKSPKVRTTP